MTPIQKYMQFHGRRPQSRGSVNFHDPKTLIFLGRAISIVYESNKKHGGGDGKLCEYEHEFESPVYLYMDETGKKQLYILGKHLFVNEDGIQN